LRWTACQSISAKIGCSARTLPDRVKKAWLSFEAVEFAALECFDWFNHRRLTRPIGDIPPAEAEKRYHAVLDRTAMAA
jgi:transposase InsO family protein